MFKINCEKGCQTPAPIQIILYDLMGFFYEFVEKEGL